MGEPARAPAKAKPVAGKKPTAAKKKPAAGAEAPAKGNRRGHIGLALFAFAVAAALLYLSGGVKPRQGSVGADAEITYLGLNHLSWITSVRKDGEELLYKLFVGFSVELQTELASIVRIIFILTYISRRQLSFYHNIFCPGQRFIRFPASVSRNPASITITIAIFP